MPKELNTMLDFRNKWKLFKNQVEILELKAIKIKIRDSIDGFNRICLDEKKKLMSWKVGHETISQLMYREIK